jgi:hypothetical protein
LVSQKGLQRGAAGQIAAGARGFEGI